jgi:hypothetical protein
MPSFGVTIASQEIIDWSTNYPAVGSMRRSGGRVKR